MATTTAAPTVLTTVPANIRPSRPTRPRTTAHAAKRSDYEVVAALPKKPVAVSTDAEPAAAAAPVDPKNPKTPKPTKPRKKFLCETPPTLLQDAKGRAEYDRGRQLGEGGFARCFLVQNKEGGMFAAKTVSKKSLANHKMRSKFFGEIQVHKTMIHPNVVRFIECFEDPANIYMILELCPNKTLMEMLRKRKRFTEPEVRFYIVQLLGALKYMHGKRVIHRDLKLGNIFLDEDMNIKIGDFGLAALLVDDNERKKTICGTPNYIAPEVLFNSGKEGEGHSFEVDLWAVGVIMYAMLCGKPPFQSGDVDSIYKKIRQNTFEWPEHITVSHSAKMLVSSLLNSDPTARPSLDEIASHNFFKTGYFPKSIPVSALRVEPQWPNVNSQNLAHIATSRLEWKKNYEEVARACGVGIDEAGKPMNSVGEEPGKPMPIVPMPQSRPSSVASSGAENDCVDVQKLLEKKREAQLKKEAAKDYMLPEALSPRDGHARMRNVAGLRAVPSRLTASKGGALGKDMPAKATIEEETEPESEKEPEVKPIRALDKKPIRRSSRENSEEAAEAPAAKVPARRPVTRSHAAQQRELEVRPTYTRRPPIRASTRKTETAESAEEKSPEPAPAPAPPRRTARATLARKEALGEPENKPASTRAERPKNYFSPEHIPHGAAANSRIGIPIPGTATTDVLSSLTPIVTNLNAFITNNVSSLPSTPSATTTAVNNFKAGRPNTAVFITKWVDYTNKYGVAYILSDGTAGAFFNDNTSLVVSSSTGDKLEWITQSLVPNAPTTPHRKTQEVISRRLATTMTVIKERAKTSRGLNSKLTIWRRTVNYMNSNLGSTDIWAVAPTAAIREPSIPPNTPNPIAPENLLWVTHYARLRRCVLFRLVDGTLQLNFVDHTKIILTANARTVRIITAEHEMRVMSLEEAARACHAGKDDALERFGLMGKLGYVKEVCKVWAKTGRFPGGIDRREGEGVGVVLGEGPEAV